MAANRKVPAPPAISTTTAPDKPESAVRLSPLFTPAFMYVMFAMVVLRRIYGPLPQFIAADLGTSVALVAQSLTVETIFSVAAALLISPLADSLGRRPVILVAIAMRTVGAGLIWLFPGIPTLFIGAALLGFGNGIVFPQIFSTVGDLFKSQPRDRLIAWLLVISRFAFLAGPLASGFLAEVFHWSAAFAAGSLVSVAALVLAWFVTPRRTTRPGSLPAVVATMAAAYRHLIGDRVINLTLIANIVFVIGGYGIDVYFGAFVAFSYGLSPDRVGLLLTVGPAVAMISTWISGRIPGQAPGMGAGGGQLNLFAAAGDPAQFPGWSGICDRHVGGVVVRGRFALGIAQRHRPGPGPGAPRRDHRTDAGELFGRDHARFGAWRSGAGAGRILGDGVLFQLLYSR